MDSGIKHIYLIGIGGIGMSGLARYYHINGYKVYGYDRTSTEITRALESEGISIHYESDTSVLQNLSQRETLIVYTPAVSEQFEEMTYACELGFKMIKRSEALGELTRDKFAIAIAGTHGKTTTSSMVAHMLNETIGCSAFLGGVATNFDSNVLFKESDNLVVEADEYDRSFLRLSPNVAVVTSMEADHLDIYGEGEELIKSFHDFLALVPADGIIIAREGLPLPKGGLIHTYGLNDRADVYADNIRIEDSTYVFDVRGAIRADNLKMGMPGIHNVENALATLCVGLQLGLKINAIAESLLTFRGVKRRFEYHVKKENLVYIDDYAHHPTELERCITSVRQLYPGRQVTGIFQPHLFSRTRDFADDFARSLELLDVLYLLDIYPARELPISGVNSAWLLDKVNLKEKKLVMKEEVVSQISNDKPEVVLTLGAGDIDQLVEPLTKALA